MITSGLMSQMIVHESFDSERRVPVRLPDLEEPNRYFRIGKYQLHCSHSEILGLLHDEQFLAKSNSGLALVR